ncbi:MAG: DUF748 domain-containing protein, partial [Deltaproteobacteria bacterium]|nr:DUF748 domain-containing protein [Deltaproteobacteria bacterium]
EPAANDRMLRLPQLLVDGIHYDWNNNLLEIASVATEGGDVKLLVTPDGKLNIPTVIERVMTAPAGSSQQSAPSNAPALPGEPFKLHVHSLALRDYALSFENKVDTSPGIWELEKVNIEVKQFRLGKGNRSSVLISFLGKQGGKIGIQGDLSVFPLAVAFKADVRELPLKLSNPALKDANLHFDDGSLTSNLDVRLSLQEKFNWRVSGDITLNQPTLLAEDLPQPLFAAQEVALRSALLEGEPLEVSAEELSFQKPAVYYQLKANPSDQAQQNTEETEGQSAEPKVSVGVVRVQDGDISIVDLFSRPSTKLAASDLAVEMKNFALVGADSVQLNSQGKIFGDGTVKIEADYIPDRFPENVVADLKIERMPLANLSHYAARFLGRSIKAGRISVDLSAKATRGLLKAENKIVLHHLTLGKLVPSKDAIDIPLGVVIPLLRDSNGNITLDVPISGNTTNPSFDYMGQLGTTLRDNLVHLAASPLTMLSTLYNWSGGSLQEILFKDSSAILPEQEIEKLQVLAKAMLDRPALELAIHGASSPDELEGKGSPAEIEALADDRAMQIKQALEAAGVPAGRLFLSEAVTNKNIKNDQVASELKLIFSD